MDQKTSIKRHIGSRSLPDPNTYPTPTMQKPTENDLLDLTQLLLSMGLLLLFGVLFWNAVADGIPRIGLPIIFTTTLYLLKLTVLAIGCAWWAYAAIIMAAVRLHQRRTKNGQR